MTIIQLSETNILGTVIAFILGLFIVPMVIEFSAKKGLMDLPGKRKIHSHPISRLGGIAIWLCTVLTLVSVIIVSHYPHRALLSGIITGSSLMFLLGLIDDIYMLEAKFKFIIQITIATIVYCLGIKISTLFIPLVGMVDLNGILSYIVTIGWIVGISNAVNFIDGVDGLAGSVITISSVTIGLISLALVQTNNISILITLIAFILAGAMLGFLTYNFHPAKIFMGDSGALFSGFLLATLSIMYQIAALSSPDRMQNREMTMYVPLLVLAVPIFDIVFSSLRRIMKGISPFTADSEHIHHKLLKCGFSQNQAVLILVIFSVIMGALAALIVASNTIKYFIYAIVLSSVMIILNRFAKYERKEEE